MAKRVVAVIHHYAQGKGRPTTPAPLKDSQEESIKLPLAQRYPVREVPGMLFCVSKGAHIALMRCGEYQAQGCWCPSRATSYELAQLVHSMRGESESPRGPIKTRSPYSKLTWLPKRKSQPDSES